MRLLKLSVVLVLVVIVSSCAYFRISEDEFTSNLESQIELFTEFKISGVIEYNHKQFSFRKNISLRKKGNALRLDIFDSGIMGMNPTPFLSVYADTAFVFRSSAEDFVLSENDKENIKLVVTVLRSVSTSLSERKAELLRNRHVKIDDIMISTNKYGFLETVSVPLQCSEVKMNYRNNKGLSELIVEQYNKNVINIKIDKITTAKVKVLPIIN